MLLRNSKWPVFHPNDIVALATDPDPQTRTGTVEQITSPGIVAVIWATAVPRRWLYTPDELVLLKSASH